MKRRGPQNGCGPRSERKLRVAGEHSLSRSDSGRASPPSNSSLSKLAAPSNLLVGTALTVVLTALGQNRFGVSFGVVQIVKSSTQPLGEAARVLHRNGYPDYCRLIARHEGADHYAISGPLGFWRKRRVREDRGLPRYVAWEARPRRVGAKKGLSKPNASGHRASEKTSPATTPGAAQALPPSAATSEPGGTP
jgi:hypothetical protein